MPTNYLETSVQKGGIAGILGCLGHIGVITQLIREAKEGKGNLAVLRLNLANAYGSVPYKFVEEALKRYRVPICVRNLI